MPPLVDRVGALTLGATTYDLRLAPGRAMPYQPNYREVWPADTTAIAGQAGKTSADPSIRYWRMTKWDGGEGNEVWVPGENRYFTSIAVAPQQQGDGLTLGHYDEKTVHDNATPAVFTQGRRLGIALGNLYAAGDGATVHAWQPATDDWDETGTATGSGAAVPCSITDYGDGANLVIGYRTGDPLRCVLPGGANFSLYDEGPGVPAGVLRFTEDPVVQSYRGSLFALNGSDLWEITGVDTKADPNPYEPGISDGNYHATTPLHSHSRMCASDVGVQWFGVDDNGTVYIFEYNVATSTGSVIGTLPVTQCYPYSIFYSNGYTFVSFRYAALHALVGDAYVYYQKGGQRGVAGRMRPTSATSARSLRIGGVIGDDLYLYYHKAIWTYNLSTGGISQRADSQTTSEQQIYQAITYGKDLFLANVDDADKVERYDTTLYSSRVARIQTGRYDFDMPGVDKILLDVTVVVDPLPANTTLTCNVSIEGAAFAALTGTFDTDDLTTYTWTASDNAASLVGKDFDIRLLPRTTDTAVSPTVRSITARAIAADHQCEWTLELDMGTRDSGSVGHQPRASDLLGHLEAIGTAGVVGLFTNPWEVEEWDAPSTHDVTVTEVLSSHEEGPGIAVLKLRETAYV